MNFGLAGAKKSREVVYSVLRDACIDGDLSVPEAVEATKDIFGRNAIHFYKIKPAISVVSSCNNLSQELNINALESDTSLVRIIWVDVSGQHRCRVSLSEAHFYPYLIPVFHSLNLSFVNPRRKLYKKSSLMKHNIFFKNKLMKIYSYIKS